MAPALLGLRRTLGVDAQSTQDARQSPQVDVAVIGTPPQWHALQLIACIEHGLDVYCEKPLAYDIREGRAMLDAVKNSDRVVQIGFQRRQSLAYHQVGANSVFH